MKRRHLLQERPVYRPAPLGRPGAPATWEPVQRTLTDEFIRGSITTGILAALQGPGPLGSLDRRTLRLALQGGAALAAGTAAAQAFRQARHGRALLAVAAGAAAVAATEHFLNDSSSLNSPKEQLYAEEEEKRLPTVHRLRPAAPGRHELR
ncbi:MAG: hypothetical protein Q4A16_08330 [Lautropia sp.]|nr:hypothetical protein [Lautropia sp.]